MSKENNDPGWRPGPHCQCETNFCGDKGLLPGDPPTLWDARGTRSARTPSSVSPKSRWWWCAPGTWGEIMEIMSPLGWREPSRLLIASIFLFCNFLSVGSWRLKFYWARLGVTNQILKFLRKKKKKRKKKRDLPSIREINCQLLNTKYWFSIIPVTQTLGKQWKTD